LKINLNH